jgi:hypothetical protein
VYILKIEISKMMLNEQETKKNVGNLFQPWEKRWGLRGDPFLWDEMSKYLAKEPLPASASQLMELLEKSFALLVGCPISYPLPSVYVDRFDCGGLSGGHICFEFWREEVLPELHSRYLVLRYMDSMRSPRMIDKPCRYESYPGGCRFGATSQFHHSKPVVHTSKPINSHGCSNHNPGHRSVSGTKNKLLHRSGPHLLMTPTAASVFLPVPTIGYPRKNENQFVAISPKSVLEFTNSRSGTLDLGFIPQPAPVYVAHITKLGL